MVRIVPVSLDGNPIKIPIPSPSISPLNHLNQTSMAVSYRADEQVPPNFRLQSCINISEET